MVELHLVRHARPRQDPHRPPWEWGLAPGAAVGIRRLRDSGVLPTDARWLSSSELKATATAALLTDADVPMDEDLREAVRSGEYVDRATFERRVSSSFADLATPAAPGWEPLVATRSRVVLAAQAAVAGAGGRDVVLVGHGTALTLLVAALTGTAPDVPAWRHMLFPDHCRLTWPDRVMSPWGRWAP